MCSYYSLLFSITNFPQFYFMRFLSVWMSVKKCPKHFSLFVLCCALQYRNSWSLALSVGSKWYLKTNCIERFLHMHHWTSMLGTFACEDCYLLPVFMTNLGLFLYFCFHYTVILKEVWLWYFLTDRWKIKNYVRQQFSCWTLLLETMFCHIIGCPVIAVICSICILTLKK